MKYFLYYAGMGPDMSLEQVGLAISTDGLHFERVENDGLIIPIDPNSTWRPSRTCNPTVLKNADGFIMYFQGISINPRKTTIAIAHSDDGVNWKDIEPILSVDTAEISDLLETDKYETKDLIEPAVIYDNRIYKMWFISRGLNEKNNRLHYAESDDGKRWMIKKTDLLAGKDLKDAQVYYPQILKKETGHYELYLSLKFPTGNYSIIKFVSPDGISFDNYVQVVPLRSDIKSWDIPKLIRIPKIRGLAQLLVSSLIKMFSNNHTKGYAHAHLVRKDDIERLYYHGYHQTHEGKTFMNIGCWDLKQGELQKRKIVLDRNSNDTAWDSYFVADPYVLIED